MKRKGRGFSEVAALTGGVGSTKVLLQLGLDVEAIISSAYPSISFGGRNSTGH
jgi:hypothetical protein